MLKRIRLENFKSWKELDIELAPLTLLFGTNSSGKTSILQALLLLKQTASSLDPGEHINFGSDQDYVDLGSYRNIVFGHEPSKRVNIGFIALAKLRHYYVADIDRDYDYVSTFRDFEFDVTWEELKDRVAINSLRYSTKPYSDTGFDLPNQIDIERDKTSSDEKPKYKYTVSSPWLIEENKPLPSPQNCYIIPRIVRVKRLLTVTNADGSIEEYPYFYDLSEYNLAFESIISQISYLGPLREPPKRTYQWQGSQSQIIGMRGDNAINALIASSRGSRSHENLLKNVSTWLQNLGLAAELTISAIDRERRFYETLLTVAEGRSPSSLPDVGFGVSQVLPVLTLLFFAPEGSIVLIEQPELHLHPSAQAELADLFLEVAEKRKLQLIVESHSEHLLRRLQRRIAEADSAYATPETIRAYFCEPGSEGSTIREVEVDEYGQIRNWPENFFGDLAGDLDAMMSAALERRRRELSEGG